MFEAVNATFALHWLEPVIDRRFAFLEAKEALMTLAKGEHVGKMVIVVDFSRMHLNSVVS